MDDKKQISQKIKNAVSELNKIILEAKGLNLTVSIKTNEFANTDMDELISCEVIEYINY